MSKLIIRRYRSSDAEALRAVFYSAVHHSTELFYHQQQREVWAPFVYDHHRWLQKLNQLRPFVALYDEQIVGYADLQSDGYIDHFFVDADFQNQGIGEALWQTILLAAKRQGINHLFADVSLAAERFFLQHGFKIEQRQQVCIQGCYLANARMSRRLNNE